MKIYVVALEMVKSVHALSRKVQRQEPDLARQMRRCSASVPLNLAEAWHARAGNRTARFDSAIQEAREAIASLDVSVACGYLTQMEASRDLDRLDHIVAACWRLSRARR